MQDHLKSKLPEHNSLTPYVVGWAGLAVVALVYMTVAIAQPDLLETVISSTPDTATPETNEGQRARSAAMAEAKRLNQQVVQMRNKLADAKAAVRSHSAKEEEYLKRIAELEKAAEAKQPSVSGAGNIETSSNQTQSENKKSSAGGPAKGTVTAAKVATAKILNKQQTTLVKSPAKAKTPAKIATKLKPAQKTASKSIKPKPKKVATAKKPKTAIKPKKKLETASLAAQTKPLDFGPALVTPAQKPIGVTIATGQSVDSLRLSWDALSEKHGGSLQRLQPRYVTGINETGLTYDLVAGPIGTAEDANRVCNKLRASGVRCAIGEFMGNAL